MQPSSTITLIVPTRDRPDLLRRFLDSIAATASSPQHLEIVLVIDEDEVVSRSVNHPKLSLRRIFVSPGLTMGALNQAGYEAATGEYLMLLNDDVIVRTKGWDRTVRDCFRRFPDPYALFHVNDTLMGRELCTFPLVSRAFCELAGGICPSEYRRYRIDDHIEDVFNLLAALGLRRTIFLPDVVFEHTNAVVHGEGVRTYQADPAILALDAPVFDRLFPSRKELALQMVERIQGECFEGERDHYRRLLDAIVDPFAIRIAGRQIVVRAPWWRRSLGLGAGCRELWRRARRCIREKGFRGLGRAIMRRLWLR